LFGTGSVVSENVIAGFGGDIALQPVKEKFAVPIPAIRMPFGAAWNVNSSMKCGP
jgi:hypothetical protein